MFKYNDKKYKEWRKKVYERDNYKCQLCGDVGQINAHHIKRKADYPGLVYNTRNGIVLCVKCHTQVTGAEYYIAPLFEAITNNRLNYQIIKNTIKNIKKYRPKLYEYIQKNIDKISRQLYKKIVISNGR